MENVDASGLYKLLGIENITSNRGFWGDSFMT